MLGQSKSDRKATNFFNDVTKVIYTCESFGKVLIPKLYIDMATPGPRKWTPRLVRSTQG